MGGRGNPIFASYSIDSRTLARNDLFVAIVGPNHDGHAFIPEAVRKGSGGLIVSREVSAELRGEVPTVRVGDTHAALKDLATHVRERSPLRVIGVTGSAGKTTTKEMAHLVLSGQFTSYASPGNLNNLYGLPLALLRMPEGTDTAVLEGPSGLMFWPICIAFSLRISQLPRARERSRADRVASAVRKVMYRKTLNRVKYSCRGQRMW